LLYNINTIIKNKKQINDNNICGVDDYVRRKLKNRVFEPYWWGKVEQGRKSRNED